MIIAHRINTIEELEKLPKDQGIEFDVRDSNGVCIVQHDAFKDGILLDDFLQKVGSRFLIVNIKSEGIEKKVLSLLNEYHLDNFFLLDCSLPKIVELTNQKERRIAIRFSEFESIESVLSFRDKVEWVWIDCFTHLPLSVETVKQLKDAGMKFCLVSPELQGQPEKIQNYIEQLLLQSIYIDAVCTKYHKKDLWEQYYNRIRKETGLFICHQGWTDIINSLAFFQYFSRLYKKLYVFIRDDSLHFHRFYTSQLANIEFICIPLVNNHQSIEYTIKQLRDQEIPLVKDEDMHLIGFDDKNRNDFYKNAFSDKLANTPFWRNFYTAYDIPFSVRVNYFEIKRDIQAEQKFYARIVKQKPYTVTHIIEKSGQPIPLEDLAKIGEGECYELHGLSSSFFEAIEVLRNAQAMYLIDSLWASVCYHLDVKYRYFKDIPITVFCLRNWKGMFIEPVHLPNWTFIEY